jgi:methionyl-tRNA formyltransferase
MRALESLPSNGHSVIAVISLRPQLAAKRSGAADYAELSRKINVPYYEVANINDVESVSLLRDLDLDLAFVIGWTQIVRAEALGAVKIGMIGAHASLLPLNRGRAPINWALIRGAKETGNSLIWLTEGVDRGEIIDQTAIPITPYDTCATLYDRVAESNREMILDVLPKLLGGKRPGRPQPETGEPDLPGRRPEDGLIDWSRRSLEVYNFIRALTMPYPGAFSWLNGKRYAIWQCALLPDAGGFDAKAGQVLGPVFSPADVACGQVVACGQGAVLLLQLEDDDGQILEGRDLSEQDWKGKSWGDERT